MSVRWITCANCKKVTNDSFWLSFNKLNGESMDGYFCRFCETDVKLRSIPQSNLCLNLQVELKRPTFYDINNILPLPEDIFNIINDYYNTQFDFWIIKFDELLQETITPFYKVKQLRIIESTFDLKYPSDISIEKKLEWITPRNFWEREVRLLILEELGETFQRQELPLFLPSSLSNEYVKIKRLKRKLKKATCKASWLERNTKNQYSDKLMRLRCKITYNQHMIHYKRQKLDTLSKQHLFITW